MPERSDLVRSVKSGGDIFSLGTLLVDETGRPIRDGRLFCRDFRVRDEVAPFEGVELLDIIEKVILAFRPSSRMILLKDKRIYSGINGCP